MAPSPPGVVHRRALGRRLLAEADVLLLLVLEAAHEAAAQSRDLRRVEGQVLLLGHADGDRIVPGREQRAAQAPAARAQPADHPRLFARAHLPQLDAGLEGLGQIGHQRAEVHPLVGVEAEGDLLSAEGDVGAHQLHVEAVSGDHLPAGDHGLLAQVLGSGLRLQVLAGGQPRHLLRAARAARNPRWCGSARPPGRSPDRWRSGRPPGRLSQSSRPAGSK